MDKNLMLEIFYSQRFVWNKEWIIVDKVCCKNSVDFINDPNYISITRSLNSIIGEELFANLNELQRHLKETAGLDLNCIRLINREDQINTLKNFKDQISSINSNNETTKKTHL